MVQDCTGWTGNGGNGLGTGSIRSCKVTASANYTVLSLILDTTSPSATANVIIALYSDNGGVPHTLLATTASTPNVSGAHEYSLTIPYIVGIGIDYWIAFQVSGTIDVLSQWNSPTPPAGTNQIQTYGYGAFPATMSVSFTSTTGHQMCTVGASAPSGGTRLPPPPIVLGGL